MFKDLYKLLEISPSATPDKIKRAFRVSALKYHPDRTFNNKALEEKFREVKIAYETLADAKRRKLYDLTYINHYRQYHHKQQTTYSHAPVKARVTPQAYLKALRQLKANTDKLKWHQVNQVTLLAAINKLLPDKVIQSLKAHDDLRLNREVNALVLHCCKKLHKINSASIIAKLIRLAGTDNEALQLIHRNTESDLKIFYGRLRGSIKVVASKFVNPLKSIPFLKKRYKPTTGMGC